MTSWFFIEMAAKSAAICGVVLIAAFALKRRAAADRALVLRIGVGLLLALPLVDAAFPAMRIEAFAPAAPAAGPALSQTEIDALTLMAAGAPANEPSSDMDWALVLVLGWAAGAMAVALRLAAGLLTLRRWTRRAEPADDPHWLNALVQARAATDAPARLRLLVGDGVPGPLGWGWRRPVILLDRATYAAPEQAAAVLAHEVAHVARRDWPALMLGKAATAMFWFNPLVWVVAREALQQAEEAADAHAARLIDPAQYAQTLLSLVRSSRVAALPANSITPGARSLARRIQAVLEARGRDASAGSHLAKAAILLCVGMAGPVAALELVEAAARPVALATAGPRLLASASVAGPVAPLLPAAPHAPQPATAPDALPTPAAPGHAGAPHPPRAPDAWGEEAPPPTPLAPPTPFAPPAPPQPSVPAIAVAAVEAQVLRNLPNPAEIEAQVRTSLPDPAAIDAHVRASLAAGSQGMMRGAEGMEQGADSMVRAARRFRDPAERARIIARERARGRTVTHAELLEAARGMEDGARDMRDAAREMRESAREMARGG